MEGVTNNPLEGLQKNLGGVTKEPLLTYKEKKRLKKIKKEKGGIFENGIFAHSPNKLLGKFYAIAPNCFYGVLSATLIGKFPLRSILLLIKRLLRSLLVICDAKKIASMREVKLLQ
jgi:hypothetical protein